MKEKFAEFSEFSDWKWKIVGRETSRTFLKFTYLHSTSGPKYNGWFRLLLRFILLRLLKILGEYFFLSSLTLLFRAHFLAFPRSSSMLTCFFFFCGDDLGVASLFSLVSSLSFPNFLIEQKQTKKQSKELINHHNEHGHFDLHSNLVR